LDSARFRISKDTDYAELDASLSILDIAVDNGRSDGVDIGNEHRELAFNRQIDELGACIKALWSAINDAGASFISRIDAKETMEEIRHRLIYTVRTRPKAKRSVFDAPEADQDDQREIHRQSSFMENHFNSAIKDGRTEIENTITVTSA